MTAKSNPNQFARKLRIPADIVHIALPLLCWGLLAFRWCGLWLTKPWMVGVIVFYYTLAAAYLVFALVVRMRVVDIIGLLLLITASLVMWIPYHWVLAILLIPALFMALHKRGNKAAAIVFTALAGVYMAGVIMINIIFIGLVPDKYAYHMSPDGHYIALEHQYKLLFYRSTDVLLYRVNGPLLIHERTLYLADASDFGGDIQWIDESTILIYGDTMDVIEDPIIKNYTPL